MQMQNHYYIHLGRKKFCIRLTIHQKIHIKFSPGNGPENPSWTWTEWQLELQQGGQWAPAEVSN